MPALVLMLLRALLQNEEYVGPWEHGYLLTATVSLFQTILLVLKAPEFPDHTASTCLEEKFTPLSQTCLPKDSVNTCRAKGWLECRYLTEQRELGVCSAIHTPTPGAPHSARQSPRWEGKATVGPPFRALKMLRTAHLDLIGSFGSAEVKMIKTLQYSIEMCQLSSLENACTGFSCQCLSQILYWVGGRSYHQCFYFQTFLPSYVNF